MPNIKSAKKRRVLSDEANIRNRAKRSRLRTIIKSVRESTDVDEARRRLREAYTLLDRAARTHLLHPNKAARLKSQLARRVDALSG